jgi:hypothetical protein
MMSHSDATLRHDSAVLLQDLYDGLQMKAILQHEEVKQIRDGTAKPMSAYNKKKRTRWQHWLDDLCLLCDSHRGGITTASIAVEKTTDGATFWLTMNAGDLEKASMHLADVLDLVKKSREMHEDPNGIAAMCEICARAIAWSPQRVMNYANRLNSVLQRVNADNDLDYNCQYQPQSRKMSCVLTRSRVRNRACSQASLTATRRPPFDVYQSPRSRQEHSTSKGCNCPNDWARIQ